MKEPQLACLYVPALPLQLLAKTSGVPMSEPLAVVKGEEVKPLAEILWVNRAARALGVQRGMRLAQGRSLAQALHADVVSPAAIAQGVRTVWQLLLGFTPSVEPCAEQVGLFWLDPTGLGNLYDSLTHWSAAVHAAVRQQGLRASVVAGFNRYFAYALACTHRDVFVATDPAQERAEACGVSLAQLHVSASLRDALGLLGIHTLGALLRLPVSELRERFGEEAERIHRVAHGTTWTPLQPQQLGEPLHSEQQIEPADADHGRLLFAIKSMLQPLAQTLRERCEAFVALHLRLQITARQAHQEQVRPATPTLDERVLLELMRLRLGAVQLAGPVESIAITVQSVRVDPSQLALLVSKPRRDLQAATLALAKLRAALGDAAVTRARMCAANPPESRFTWESITQARLPADVKLPVLPPLVRQVLPQPRPLPPRPRHEPELWLNPTFGVIRDMQGPFRVSTQWWSRPLQRDYYYAFTQRDYLLWLYHDRAQRRWFLHGLVD